MKSADSHDVTQLLAAATAGDACAAEQLLPLVYEELRELARQRMAKEPAGHTLQPTALVHEAYLRLVRDQSARWENRGHFFAAAARAMRRILIERARKKDFQKYGGGKVRVDLDELGLAGASQSPVDLLSLDEALSRLEEYDRRKHDIVMLRYFAGLTIEETAKALGTSPRTVSEEWRFSKAWLRHEMSSGDTEVDHGN